MSSNNKVYLKKLNPKPCLRIDKDNYIILCEEGVSVSY